MNKLFEIKIIQPRFDRLYKEYEEKNKTSISSGKSIGILNKGKSGKFLNNEFLGLDIGIQDEGKNTLASGNKFFKNTPRVEKIEIIGRDKIEQHGNKSEASIENAQDNRSRKRRFSMDNPVIWIIFFIIAGLILILIRQILTS